VLRQLGNILSRHLLVMPGACWLYCIVSL